MGTVEIMIREIIKSRYRTITRFAQVAGLPAQTVYSALRNGLTKASVATVMPIAMTLGIDPQQIFNGRLEESPGYTVEVPLLGAASAGLPAEAIECSEAFPIPQAIHSWYPEGFLVRVSGESMNRVLPNGCYALVDPVHEITVDGGIYVARIGENTATIKRAKRLRNGIELLPDSTDPTFHPQIVDFSVGDAPQVTIVGRVVWYTLPYRWKFET